MSITSVNAISQDYKNYTTNNENSKSYTKDEKAILKICEQKTDEIYHSLKNGKEIHKSAIQYILNKSALIGVPEKINSLFEIMREFKFAPNINHKISLLQACMKGKDPLNAEKVFNEILKMRAETKVVFDNIIPFTILIKACCVFNQLDIAEELLQEMEQESIQPDDILYSILVDRFFREKLEKARDFFKKISKDWLPDIVVKGKDLIIDSHGITAGCLYFAVEPLLQDIIDGKTTDLQIITGKGLHSNNIPFDMRNTIITFLNEWKDLEVTIHPKNEGVIVIRKRALDEDLEKITQDLSDIAITDKKNIIEYKDEQESEDDWEVNILTLAKSFKNLISEKVRNFETIPVNRIVKYRRQLHQAMLDDPTYDFLHFCLGATYCRYNIATNNFKKAEFYYRRSILLNPDDAHAWQHLGWLLSQVNYCDPVKAKEALIRAHELNPSDKKTLELLVQLVLMPDHTLVPKERDVRYYVIALQELDKDNIYAQFYWGQYYDGKVDGSEQKPKLALKYYKQIFEQNIEKINDYNPTEHRVFIKALQRAGIICEEAKELDTALTLFEKIEQFDPNVMHKEIALNVLGRRAAIHLFKMLKSEKEQAKIEAKNCLRLNEKILKIDENDVQALIMQARLYCEGNYIPIDYKKSFEYYQKASKIDPNDDFVRFFTKRFLPTVEKSIKKKGKKI